MTLGFTELSAGQNDKASIIFEKILEINENNFDAWFNLAVSKAKAGSLEDALSCFRQADGQQNDNQQLKANIITLLKDLNRIDEAWKN